MSMLTMGREGAEKGVPQAWREAHNTAGAEESKASESKGIAEGEKDLPCRGRSRFGG